MRALVQRVARARVSVDEEEVGTIGPGLLVLLGVARGDTEKQADRLADKIVKLRVFPAEGRPMHRSVAEVGGRVLCVSQFTLYGDTGAGNRPSFMAAAPPEEAEPLYDRVRARLGAQGGRFGAHMLLELVNDGPVTLMIEV